MPELSMLSSLSPMTRPPSQILKDSFNDLKGKELSDADAKKLSQATLASRGSPHVV